MKCDNCCMGADVHYVTLVGDMRPAKVVMCNDDDCGTVELCVFTMSNVDVVHYDTSESTHPVAHVSCVKHCPNMTPGTYHLPSEMK